MKRIYILYTMLLSYNMYTAYYPNSYPGAGAPAAPSNLPVAPYSQNNQYNPAINGGIMPGMGGRGVQQYTNMKDVKDQATSIMAEIQRMGYASYDTSLPLNTIQEYRERVKGIINQLNLLQQNEIAILSRQNKGNRNNIVKNRQIYMNINGPLTEKTAKGIKNDIANKNPLFCIFIATKSNHNENIITHASTALPIILNTLGINVAIYAINVSGDTGQKFMENIYSNKPKDINMPKDDNYPLIFITTPQCAQNSLSGTAQDGFHNTAFISLANGLKKNNNNEAMFKFLQERITNIMRTGKDAFADYSDKSGADKSQYFTQRIQHHTLYDNQHAAVSYQKGKTKNLRSSNNTTRRRVSQNNQNNYPMPYNPYSQGTIQPYPQTNPYQYQQNAAPQGGLPNQNNQPGYMPMNNPNNNGIYIQDNSGLTGH